MKEFVDAFMWCWQSEDWDAQDGGWLRFTTHSLWAEMRNCVGYRGLDDYHLPEALELVRSSASVLRSLGVELQVRDGGFLWFRAV